MGTINITGTGGIIEGNLGAANVDVNLDQCNSFSGTGYKMNSTSYFTSSFDDVTIMFWATRDDLTDKSSDRLFTANGGNDLRIYLQNDVLRFRHTFADDTVSEACQFNLTNEINKDDWFHIAAVYDGSAGVDKLFLNGVEKGSASVSKNLKALSSATDAWSIARRVSTTAESYAGKIADCKIYSTALGEPEIKIAASKINKDPSLISSTGPVGYWPIVGTTIDVTDNASGSSNDMSALGTPTVTTDKFHVDVYDGNDTRTTGDFEISQGKVEGKALTSLAFDGTDDRVDIGELGDYTAISMTAWVKPDDALPSNQGIVGFESNKNGIATGSGNNTLRIKHESVNSSFTDTTYTWLQNEWQQVGFSWDGSTLNVYAGGIQINSVSLSGSAWGTTGANIGVLTAGIWHFNGEIRDVRLYDYGLSEEQMASLYSNTYPQTPKHHYKLDDSILGFNTDTPVDSGTSSTLVNGTLTGMGASARRGEAGVESGWQNGTLDLNGDLTIDATGTFSAPREKVTIAANFNNSGGFTHNQGIVEFDGTPAQNINNSGTAEPTFFKLQEAKSGSETVQVCKSITVLKELNFGSRFFQWKANVGTIIGTFGDADNQCTIEDGNRCMATLSGAGPVKFYGGSQLKPFIVTTGGPNHQADAVHYKNMDYRAAHTTNGVTTTFTLDGDCEFDAFTVSANDTLDLKGQRAVFSGTFNAQGTDGLKDTAGGGMMFTDNINYQSASAAHSSVNTIHYIGTGHSGDHNIQEYPFKTIFMNSGGAMSFNDYGPLQTAATDKFIIGAGSVTGFGLGGSAANGSPTFGNITVSTAGTLIGGGDTLTCSGDFTTSGGLLGASCLDLEKDNKEYVRIPVDGSTNTHLQSPHTSGAMTVEAWVKIESDAEMAVWHKGTDYVFSVNPSGGATKLAWADGSHYSFSSWEHNLESGQLNVGKWHHLACVRDVVGSNGRASYYIDGKLVGQVTNTSSNATWTDADTFDLYVGRYQDSDSGAGDNYFDGNIENLRIWNVARTDAQIRESMFTAEYADGTSGLVEQFLFNEGNSHVVAGTNPTSESTYANGAGEQYTSSEQANYTNIWAGKGTFNGDSSTLDMSGNDGKIFFLDNAEVKNLTCSGSITLDGVGASGNDLKVNGNINISGSLASEENEKLFVQGGSITFAVGTAATSIANLTNLIIANPTTVTLPALTTKQIQMDSGGTATAGGDITLTNKLAINSGGSFNANANTISCAHLDVANGATVDLRNSTYTGRTGGSLNRFDFFHCGSSVSLLTGNTTITGTTSPLTQGFFPSAANLEIVGNMSNIQVMDDGDITVVGSVTNCTLEESRGNIRQFHHTLDTQQLLDADEAGDDDLRLTKPALDNALELQTR